jgi:hypothetical protein
MTENKIKQSKTNKTQPGDFHHRFVANYLPMQLLTHLPYFHSEMGDHIIF